MRTAFFLKVKNGFHICSKCANIQLDIQSSLQLGF